MQALGGTRWREPGRVLAIAAVMAAVAAVVPALSAPLTVDAALGITAFAIDGDTAGPSDWEAPDAGVLGTPFSSVDPCVEDGANIDPDQLDGKLDALDLENPQPVPGNVTKKGDLCEVWRAIEYVHPAGGGAARPVFYGAWRRTPGASGEFTVFFPFVGPAPGNVDDLLVAFQFDDSGAGGTTMSIWRWDGSTWAPTPSPGLSFEAAVDAGSKPTFGEFAIDLVAGGVIPDDRCETFVTSYAFTRTGQENANGELEDYAGADPLSISNCGRLEVTKVAVPEPPMATEFEFTVGSIDGGPIDFVSGSTSITDDLTVPTAPDFVNPNMVPRDDLTISESATAGWDLADATCSVGSADGSTTQVSVLGGAPFTVVAGGVTRCTLVNEQRASLTIIKESDPTDGTDFPFTATGRGLSPFTLDVDTDATLPDRITFANLAPGTPYTVTESPLSDGWVFLEANCLGAASAGVSGATVTVTPEPGEQIVCTYVNALPLPATNTLIVRKVADPADGTDFAFTTTGAGLSAFSLDNDPSGAPDNTLRALRTFAGIGDGTYTVSETNLPVGWTALGHTCTDGTPQAGVTASITFDSTDASLPRVVLCTFANRKPSSLTVRKVTAPGGSPQTFTFTGGPPLTSTSLADGESTTYSDLAPGLYSMTETAVADWTLTNITCTGAATAVPLLLTGRVVVNLRAGQDAVCTYTNTQNASITVTKVVRPTGVGGPNGGFGFDTGGDGLTDRFLNDGESFTLDDLLPGTYSIDEVVPDGWSADVRCSGANVVDTDGASGTATVTVGPGENAACTYTNTKLGSIRIRKDSQPDDGQDVMFSAAFDRMAGIPFRLDDDGDSTWDAQLGLLPPSAVLTGLRPGNYTVAEQVPDGWTLDSVRCVGATTSDLDISANVVLIAYTGAEPLDCTFLNQRVVPVTTTTTPSATTTTIPTPTTTTPPSILPPTPSTIPATGSGSTTNALRAAAMLMILGSLVLVMTRRRPRTDPRHEAT